MRILIAAPRKSGGAPLRCLLSQAYGLGVVATRDAPHGSDPHAASQWLTEMPDQSVALTSFPYSAHLTAAASQTGAVLIAILRHPFDLFASNFDVAQQQAKRKRAAVDDAGAWSALAGKAIGDPEVLNFARDDFSADVTWLENWHASGRPRVRYELLETDPAAVLADLAPQLGALEIASIAHAVQLCPSENIVVSRPERGRRMPALPAGAWRTRLPSPLLALLRDRYGVAVRQLDYDAG